MSEKGSGIATAAGVWASRPTAGRGESSAECSAGWTERAALVAAICGDKLALSVEETAARTGISRSQIFELIADSDSGFPFFKVRRRTYVPTLPLIEWMHCGGAPAASAGSQSAALRGLEQALS